MEKYHPLCRLSEIMLVQTGKYRHLQDHALPLRTISLRNSLFNALVRHSRADGFVGIPYISEGITRRMEFFHSTGKNRALRVE
jgi:hypothetical protein